MFCAALRCSELDWTGLGLYETGRGGAAVQQLAGSVEGGNLACSKGAGQPMP